MSNSSTDADTPAGLTALREQRLRRTLQAVGAAHPFYRRRFREQGIDPPAIQCLQDLAALPLTSKNDYIAEPEAFRLRGEDLPDDFPPEERVLWDVAYTTGTTSGKPSPFYNTTHDSYAIMDQARRCNDAEGFRATDRVANLYPLANFPTGAFLSVVRSTMIGGFPVVHGLTGTASSEFKVRNALAEAIEKVERLRPTILWGVPSFLRRFLDEARRKGADFSEVRMVLTSGEPMPPPLRAEMKQQLAAMGAVSVETRARYAFTEMQGGLVQCAEHVPAQNVCPDLYYLEVVDPESGRPLPEGQSGPLAITHLHRRGTVMLRYLVGDIITLSTEPCPICGRLGERVVATPRRTGNLVKCRGMLVNTDVILETLSTLEGIGEYQIVFRPGNGPAAMEEFAVLLEADAASAPSEDLREKVIRLVRGAVSLRPDVEWVPRGTLYDHERTIKARRVVDLRPRVE